MRLYSQLPNYEFQLGDVPWRDDIINKPIPIEEGYLKLSQEPGPGIELNKKELTKRKAE